MCGGFAITYNNVRAYEKQFGADASKYPGTLAPSYNVRPTHEHALVVGADRALVAMRWGLIPSWSRDGHGSYATINARVETVAEKPTYRRPFRSQRALVPASGYFEWTRTPHGKQPYYVHPSDGKLMAFAGLYDTWHAPSGQKLHSFAIITKHAEHAAAGVHDRMPAVLEPADYEAWLDPAVSEPEELRLLLRGSGENLLVYPVSREVNKATNNHPNLLSPVELAT